MILIDAKLLWRDWRGGQLSLVLSALILAVTVVTAVSLFADRVERGLDQQISSFLAADLSVQGGKSIDEAIYSKTSELELQSANVAQFRSMVFAGDNNHLASIKAVEPAYPLRGKLELIEDPVSQEIAIASGGPSQGEIWVDARLLQLLDIQLGALQAAVSGQSISID